MSAAPTHVVLGGNGVAGRETLIALGRREIPTASVGRTSSTIEGTRSVLADLLDADAVQQTLGGAEVAYLTAGLPYIRRGSGRRSGRSSCGTRSMLPSRAEPDWSTSTTSTPTGASPGR